MYKYIAAILSFVCIITFTSVDAAECERVTVDEATRAEDARYAAMLSNDFAALHTMIANDLVYIHSSSLVDNKQTYIESLRIGAVKYLSIRRSDIIARTFGCVAVLTGNGNFDVAVNDKEMMVELRFHAVWVKRDDKMQFISWQATRLPAK